MSKTAVKKKAAPKKAAKKVPVKKKVAKVAPDYSIKGLRKLIEDAGYTVHINTYDESISVEIYDKRKAEELTTVSISLTSFAYCCGVTEAGDLEIMDGSYHSWNTKEKTVVEIATAIAFLSARDVKYFRENKFRPVVFCSNSDSSCVFFDNAAKKYMKATYKKVSTSINPSSDNKITIYISQP
jgi:hypothetical protein